MQATTTWTGDLTHGQGRSVAKTGAFDIPFSLKSRLGEEPKSNPEELIAAAHSGCYSMMLSALLTQAGTPPETITTTAKVTLSPDGGGFKISSVELMAEVKVPGLDAAKFQEFAQNAKTNCPVSKALSGTEIHLSASLVG
jgi:lipoyl-dependent peroxiredoxin